jgi:predicted CopG family antitoxin
VLWLKFLTAQFSDVYKRLLFYRTGDTQVSEVTAEAAAKRKRLLAVLQSAAVHMAATIGEIAGLVSPGTDFNDVLDLNIQKLDARYAGGYSDEAAHKRADLAAGEDDCSHAEPPAKDLAYPSAASPA